MEFDRGTKQT